MIASNRGQIVVLDPATNSIVDIIDPRWGVTGDDIVVGANSVWTSSQASWVHRIDPVTRQVTAMVETGTYNHGIAVAGGQVLVGNGDDSYVTRIDPGTNDAVGRIVSESAVQDIVSNDGTVWAATSDGSIHHFAPTSSSFTNAIATDGAPTALAAGTGNDVWASDPYFDRVLHITPSGIAQEIQLDLSSDEGRGLAVGLGSVWVATGDNNLLVRIDETTYEILARIDLGGWIENVAIGTADVWVALPEDATVVRLDPMTNTVTARIRVEGFPNALVVVP